MSWDTTIQLLILFILFILSKFMASRVGDFVNGPAPRASCPRIRLVIDPIPAPLSRVSRDFWTPPPGPREGSSSPSVSPDLAPPRFEVDWVHNPRARRYVLRVTRTGRVRVTIPRNGNDAFARRFLAEKLDWIRRQLSRLSQAEVAPGPWTPGTLVWYRGQRQPLLVYPQEIRLADQSMALAALPADCRPLVEAHLRRLAQSELPPLVLETAAQFDLQVGRVVIRSQRSRWGSCSRHRTISLNWRLVQVPLPVRDYLVAHELAHLREMNHSQRFWRVVEHLFPAWRDAERWLRLHGRQILG